MVKKFLRKSSRAIALACCAAMLMSSLTGCSIGGNSNDSSSSDEADNDGNSLFGKLGDMTSGSGENDGDDEGTDGDAEGEDGDQLVGGPDELDPEGGDEASYPGGLDDDGKGDDEFDPDSLPELYKRTSNEYRNTDDGTRLVEFQYDQLYLQDDIKDDYPTLEKVLKMINAEIEITEDINEIAEEAQMQLDAMDDKSYFGGYTDESTASIERLDSKVISVREHIYSYYGGAHGIFGDGGVTYDLTTGEKVSIYDVVVDEETLLNVLADKIQELYPDVWEYDLSEDTASLETAIDDEEFINWTMQTDGITIYFNPYAIAAYASGEQVVPIKFDEMPDLFTGDYWNSEVENYALEGSSLIADIDGDGTAENVSVWERYYYEEDYSYSYVDGFQIDIDGTTYEFDAFSYESSYIFVKKNNEYYLYINTLQESDYDMIYMYKLSGNEPTELGATPGELSAGPNVPYFEYDENSFNEYKGIITNLNHFYIMTRTNLCGTVTGIYDAAVGNDGRIQVADGYDGKFYIRDTEYTALVDKTYNTVDEDGNVTGTKDVKKGDTVTYYRTDDNLFADLKTSDGTIIRLDIDQSGWPYTCDGVDIETLFDGIIFAG